MGRNLSIPLSSCICNWDKKNLTPVPKFFYGTKIYFNSVPNEMGSIRKNYHPYSLVITQQNLWLCKEIPSEPMAICGHAKQTHGRVRPSQASISPLTPTKNHKNPLTKYNVLVVVAAIGDVVCLTYSLELDESNGRLD